MLLQRIFLVFLYTTSLLTSAYAFSSNFTEQLNDPEESYLDTSKFISRDSYGFIPVPIIITDPAVDGGLGVNGLIFHETSDKEKKHSESTPASPSNEIQMTPNVSAAAFAYTGNESWFTGVGHLAFWKEGKIRYAGGIGYMDLNMDFYGIGDLRLTRGLSLNTQAWGAVQSLKFQLNDSPWYVGIAQRYADAKLSPASLDLLDKLPAQQRNTLTDILTIDTKISGLGPILEFDNRDNFFSPEKGYHYRLQFLWFDQSIGSDVDYVLTKLVGKNYWPLSQDWVLGLKLHTEHASGTDRLPPFAVPQLELRGIPSGTYQGLHAQDIELELRYKLNDQWQLAGFAGAGRSSRSFSDLSKASVQTSKGVGVRYEVARKYGFYMGIDYASGPDDNVWYIQVGSPW